MNNMRIQYRSIIFAAVCVAATMCSAVSAREHTAVIDGVAYTFEYYPEITVTGHEWPASEMIEKLELRQTVSLSSFPDIKVSAEDDMELPVRFISANAFEGCNFGKIILPFGINEISREAFMNASIGDINFPASLRCVQNSAFRGVRNLKLLNLNEGLKYLGMYAFAEMPDVTDINIPGSVLLYASGSLGGLSSLESIRICSRKKPVEPNGALYNPIDYDDLIYEWTLYVPAGTIDDYIPPRDPNTGLSRRSQWIKEKIVEMEDSPMAETIKEAAGERLKVRLQGRSLTVEPAGGEPERVAVYDMHGRTVADRELNGAEALTLPQGIYVVKCGSETRKIAIR